MSRDWGWAPEYVDAMWRMLQLDRPDDFVISTGISHTLEQFTSACFSYLGLEWQTYVQLSQVLFRPADITYSCGDPSKAKLKLHWSAQAQMETVVQRMIDAELQLIPHDGRSHQ